MGSSVKSVTLCLGVGVVLFLAARALWPCTVAKQSAYRADQAAGFRALANALARDDADIKQHGMPDRKLLLTTYREYLEMLGGDVYMTELDGSRVLVVVWRGTRYGDIASSLDHTGAIQTYTGGTKFPSECLLLGHKVSRRR